jgi:hypothetical protein
MNAYDLQVLEKPTTALIFLFTASRGLVIILAAQLAF